LHLDADIICSGSGVVDFSIIGKCRDVVVPRLRKLNWHPPDEASEERWAGLMEKVGKELKDVLRLQAGGLVFVTGIFRGTRDFSGVF